MTRSPDQVGVVAKFLRKELDKGPVLAAPSQFPDLL
jgi:hypothetical protein